MWIYPYNKWSELSKAQLVSLIPCDVIQPWTDHRRPIELIVIMHCTFWACTCCGRGPYTPGTPGPCRPGSPPAVCSQCPSMKLPRPSGSLPRTLCMLGSAAAAGWHSVDDERTSSMAQTAAAKADFLMRRSMEDVVVAAAHWRRKPLVMERVREGGRWTTPAASELMLRGTRWWQRDMLAIYMSGYYY